MSILCLLYYLPSRIECTASQPGSQTSSRRYKRKTHEKTYYFQANNESSSAKDITVEILENIDLQLTSGTLTKLIEIAPRLKDLWPLDEWVENEESTEADNANVNLSLSITQDFIQITSELYHQTLAWKEMNSHDQGIYSTDLLNANELIAFRSQFLYL